MVCGVYTESMEDTTGKFLRGESIEAEIDEQNMFSQQKGSVSADDALERIYYGFAFRGKECLVGV